MKKFAVIAALFAVLLVMACTTSINAPVGASNNPIGSKVGEQTESVKIILGIFPFKWSIDASAYKAAQNGGITKIATVDVRKTIKNMVFLKNVTYTTTVTGE